MRLTTVGIASSLPGRTLGRISREPVREAARRSETFALLIPETIDRFEGEVGGYRGVLSSLSIEKLSGYIPIGGLSAITSIKETDHIQSGDVVVISGAGHIRSLYRVGSSHNTIFATDRCNSNCLMCSQPPKDKDDSYLIEENLSLIDLIAEKPAYLVITGGEPTLLGDGILRIIARLRDRFPTTPVLMLSNGRRLAHRTLAERIGRIGHTGLRVAIPIYADHAELHDYVVQAAGAFNQTLIGVHNLARCGVSVEIRVVLHALTVPRLVELAEFLYRNFPFADHVALMGLEMMGYTKRNLRELWIDPYDYRETLLRAVRHLSMRGMNVSIYNHALCVLDPKARRFARKSISDWKNIYLDPCTTCRVQSECGGFFASALTKYSAHIAPIL